MNNRVLGCLIAGALATTLALASPVLARGGGGGGGMGGGMHGGGMGGGMHGGGMGGGMHGGGMGGGMHGGGMGGGMRAGGMGGGMHVGGMSGGPRFSGGSRFAGARFAHAGFSPRFSNFAFRHHGRFIHHGHRRFAFIGVPYAYAAYDSCWRRTWTPYGLQWVNVCGDYY